jgi:hypothetical protein
MTSIVEKNVTSLARTLPHCAIQLRAVEVMTSTRVAVVVMAVVWMWRGRVISNGEQISCSFTFNDDCMVILPTFHLHD